MMAKQEQDFCAISLRNLCDCASKLTSQVEAAAQWAALCPFWSSADRDGVVAKVGMELPANSQPTSDNALIDKRSLLGQVKQWQ